MAGPGNSFSAATPPGLSTTTRQGTLKISGAGNGKALGIYCSLLTCDSTSDQTEYLQVAYRSFDDESGYVTPQSEEPLVAYRGQKPYNNTYRTQHTVSAAVHDTDHYCLAWERWSDTRYSDNGTSRPGWKIETMFVIDGEMKSIGNGNHSAEGAELTIACSPRVEHFQRWYSLSWLEYVPAQARCFVKTKQFTWRGKPLEYYSETEYYEEILDSFSWTGNADDLWLSSAIDDQGKLYLTYPVEDEETARADMRVLTLDLESSGQMELVVAPVADYAPASGAYPRPQLLVTVPDMDLIYVADVNDTGVTWNGGTMDLPVKKIIDLQDPANLGPSVYDSYRPTKIVAGRVENPGLPGTYTSKVFVILEGEDSFSYIDANGENSATEYYENYDEDRLGPGANPGAITMSSDGSVIYFTCPGLDRVKWVPSNDFSTIYEILNSDLTPAVLVNTRDVAAVEFRESGADYYLSLNQYIHLLPEELFAGQTNNAYRLELLGRIDAIVDGYSQTQSDDINGALIVTLDEIMDARRYALTLMGTAPATIFCEDLYDRLDWDLIRLAAIQLGDSTDPANHVLALAGITQGLYEANDASFIETTEQYQTVEDNMLACLYQPSPGADNAWYYLDQNPPQYQNAHDKMVEYSALLRTYVAEPKLYRFMQDMTNLCLDRIEALMNQ